MRAPTIPSTNRAHTARSGTPGLITRHTRAPASLRDTGIATAPSKMIAATMPIASLTNHGSFCHTRMSPISFVRAVRHLHRLRQWYASRAVSGWLPDAHPVARRLGGPVDLAMDLHDRSVAGGGAGVPRGAVQTLATAQTEMGHHTPSITGQLTRPPADAYSSAKRRAEMMNVSCHLLRS